MKQIVLVPDDRVGVITLDVRKEIKTKLAVTVDLNKNAVELDGEGIELQTAINIIKAVGRGFAPIRAFRLFDENQTVDIIELSSFSEARAASIKSRVIGTKGYTRERIEDSSGAAISVYGKTIGIIGTWEQIDIAKTAIEKLINGAMHSSVEKFLLRSRK